MSSPAAAAAAAPSSRQVSEFTPAAAAAADWTAAVVPVSTLRFYWSSGPAGRARGSAHHLAAQPRQVRRPGAAAARCQLPVHRGTAGPAAGNQPMVALGGRGLTHTRCCSTEPATV